MTPIYASNRIDLSGWYAYKQPPGQLVIWDGGVNRDGENSPYGFWCPFTGKPVFASSVWLKRVPRMPMFGYVDIRAESFVAADFPHADTSLNITGRTTDNPIMYMATTEGHPLPFYLSVMNAPTVFDEHPDAGCSFVPCKILPEDKDASLEMARSLGDSYYFRHPQSIWIGQRSPLFATTHRPECVVCNIRSVNIASDKVESVVAWTTRSELREFPPMYDGDQHPDNKAFIPRHWMNLYLTDGVVVGYD